MANQTGTPIEENGLLFGCVLDGVGSATLVDWNAIETWNESDGTLWVHLDRNATQVADWLKNKSGLSEVTVEALLAEETRPRVFRGKKGVVSILRGVNTNPDSDPEDMVAIRLWSDGKRVISLRYRKLLTPRDILDQLLQTENGPKDASELYEGLISRLTERMAGTVAEIEEGLDEIEASFDISRAAETRRRLLDLRQKAIALRRYMAPQREALDNLRQEPPAWLTDISQSKLRDTSDHLLRYIEEIDAERERASAIKDDIANQLAESTNKTLYVLAILTAIFMPLAFLTGLLGINIGGMPGVENPNAFWIFCGILVLVLFVEIYIFRHLKWL